MAAVLAAGLAAGLALALTGTDAQPRSAANANAGLRKAASLAQEYAPLVLLHPQERFFPISADEFLSHSRLVFFRAGQVPDLVAEGPDASLLGTGGYRVDGFRTDQLTGPFVTRPAGVTLDPHDGFVLDLDDASHCGGFAAVGCAFGPAPVYFQYGPGRYLTYWFCYAYSAPAGFDGKPTLRFGHEGDWERVAILLDEQDRPTSVAYFQHDGPPEVVTWQSASALVDGRRRPVVYEALGTHASYPKPGAQKITLGYLRGADAAARPRATFTERRAEGFEWKSWLDLRDVGAAWFGYGGTWGNRGRPCRSRAPGRRSPRLDGEQKAAERSPSSLVTRCYLTRFCRRAAVNGRPAPAPVRKPELVTQCYLQELAPNRHRCVTFQRRHSTRALPLPARLRAPDLASAALRARPARRSFATDRGGQSPARRRGRPAAAASAQLPADPRVAARGAKDPPRAAPPAVDRPAALRRLFSPATTGCRDRPPLRP